MAFYALVYPYFTYGNIVWGNTYPTRLQKLLNVQKKIVRLINFKSYMDHSEPSFKYLKILNIYQINDYLCSLFMFRFNYCQNMPLSALKSWLQLIFAKYDINGNYSQYIKATSTKLATIIVRPSVNKLQYFVAMETVT